MACDYRLYNYWGDYIYAYFTWAIFIIFAHNLRDKIPTVGIKKLERLLD